MEERTYPVVSGSSLDCILLTDKPGNQGIPQPDSGISKWSRLLYSRDFADIYIRVSFNETKATIDMNNNNEDSEETLIPCHKLILVVNSPFFWNLLQKSEDLDVIRFIDFSPEAVKVFLKFLYTDELDPAVWHTYEVLLHVMELAQKFEVPRLRQRCIQNLGQLEVNAYNSFIIWQRARDFDETEVERVVLKFITENAEKIISQLPESFFNLSHENLKALLARDDLQIEELSLFNAVFKWACRKCEQRGWELTGQAIRRVLKDAIFLIRFPVMSTSILTNLIIKTGILTTDQVSKIFRLMYHQESETDMSTNQLETYDCKRTFKTKPRDKPGPIFTLNRYGSTSTQERNCEDKFYSVMFTCDKAIALVGFTFFTVSPLAGRRIQDCEKSTLDIQVQLQKFEGTQFTFAYVHKTFTVKDAIGVLGASRKTLLVKFEYPVTIQPNICYLLQYKLNGPPTLTGNKKNRKDKLTANCKERGIVTIDFHTLPSSTGEEDQLSSVVLKLI